LLREVLDALSTLPTGSRGRFARYVPAWWNALIQPTKHWGADYAKLIDQPSLDMLGSLADVVEVQSGPSNPHTVEILKKSVDQLLRDVDATPDIPDAVRAQIRADLNHIAWLLGHVDTFGVQHAVAEVEKVAGRVVAEAVKRPKSGLKELALGLAAVLALLAPATENLETIVGNVRSVFGIEAATSPQQDLVQSTVVQVYDQCTTKELTAGPAADGNGHVPAEQLLEEEAPSHAG
jgi:hypothetical protein